MIDARQWYGLRFEIELHRDDAPFAATFTIQIPTPQPERHNLRETSSARALVQGRGWHTVTVPFSSFDYLRGQEYFLKFIKQITLEGRYESTNQTGPVRAGYNESRAITNVVFENLVINGRTITNQNAGRGAGRFHVGEHAEGGMFRLSTTPSRDNDLVSLATLAAKAVAASYQTTPPALLGNQWAA